MQCSLKPIKRMRRGHEKTINLEKRDPDVKSLPLSNENKNKKFIAGYFEISDDRIGYNLSNSTTLLECMRTEYMQKLKETPRNRTMKRKLDVKVVKDTSFTFLDNATHTVVRRVDRSLMSMPSVVIFHLFI